MIGRWLITPYRRPFPIWRYGEYILPWAERAIPVVGWHPDWYRYERVDTLEGSEQR